MQPVISVDHELRQNAHRAEETAQSAQAGEPGVTEDTPLLRRFPQGEGERSPVTTVTVTLLLIMLVAGVVIGVYLLILQSNSENILPPIETPLQLVSRRQWDFNAGKQKAPPGPLRATQVVVTQTDTQTCNNTAECVTLLRKIQLNSTASNVLAYNFLVSSNGQTYESLGWHRPSALFPEYSNTMVLAFIGNFTDVAPSKAQLDEARYFFSESVSQQHLVPTFTIIGRYFKSKPTYLFNSLKTFPQWNDRLSDS